jgi:hypothetical protein
VEFDEPVLAATLLLPLLVMQDSSPGTGAKFSIDPERQLFLQDPAYNDLFVLGNVTTVPIYLSRDDFARLALHPFVARNYSTTHLTMGTCAILSAIGQCSEPVFSNESIPVTTFLPDTAAPYVTGFAIDMQTERLYLNFSEPMDPESFDARHLTLQNQSSVALSGAFARLVTEDVVVFDVLDLQRQIVISLGRRNSNIIKATKGLCTRSINCFVSATGPFMADVSANPVTTVGFDRYFGMPCSNYSRDTTPPYLLEWSADLNSGEVYIVFSEPVHMPFFNYSACLISDHADLDDSSRAMRIEWPLKYSFVNTDMVNFTLQTSQLDILKSISGTASVPTELYLVLEPNVVTDTARLANAYRGVDATWNAARRITSLLLDSTHPDVTKAELNMMSLHLVITFSEIVDISSIDMRYLQLQSHESVTLDTEIVNFADPIGSAKIDLNKASIANTENSNVVVILFTRDIFDLLKTMNSLGRVHKSTYLSMKYTFIKDLSGNPVRTIPFSRARPIDEIFVDKNAPTLLQSILNLNQGTLDLSFSEPMDYSKFDLSRLFLSNDDVGTPATIVFYFGLDSYLSAIHSDLIRVHISVSDLSYIKTVRPALCSQSSNCFLTLESNFGFDMPFVNSEGILEQSPLAPLGSVSISQYIGDTVAPFLLGYNIDMESGQILFKFSEDIDTNSFDASGISLFYDDFSGKGSPVKLSKHCFLKQVGFQSEVTLFLSRHDYWAIQSFDGLATSRLSVLITLSSSVCVDTFGNALDGSHNPGGSPGFVDGLALIQPNKFVAVSSSPYLIAVDLKGYGVWNVTLTFSQAIDPSTVVKSKVFVSSNGNVQRRGLDAAVVFPSEKNSFFILDMNPVAQLFDSFNMIGTDQNNFYVYLPLSGAVRNVYNTPSAALPGVNAIRAGNVPISFHLNLQTRKIRVEFAFVSEFVIFSPAAVALSRPSLGLRVYLTSYDRWVIEDGAYLEIDISADDYNAIQSSVGLTESMAGLFIIIEPSALRESSGRELGRSVTLPCLRLVSDPSNPDLSHFDLNMGTGILDITFSKPVLVSTLRLGAIYLVDSNVNPSNMVQLNQSVILSSLDSPAVLSLRINLEVGPHPTDRDRIHFSQTIGASASSTFLYIADGVITDTSFPRNFIRGLNFNSAKQVRDLTLDTIRPELLSFDLDMVSRQLVLHFSEAVNPTTNIPEYYTLRQVRDYNQGSYRQLSSSSTIVPSNDVSTLSSDVTIQMSVADVDYMMFLYPTLAASASTSYLTVRSGAITDLSYLRNKNVEVFDIYALEPTIYQPDSNPPKILSFNFSIDDGLLVVELNEVVRCSATNAGAIILQSEQFLGTRSSYLKLSKEQIFIYPCDDDYSKIVYIQLSTEEVIKLKAISRLFKSPESSWLRSDAGAFIDVSGASSSTIIDGKAIPVTSYIGDFTPPRLVAFKATMQGILFLTFDEPIDIESLNVTSIVLRDSEGDEWYPGVEDYPLRSYRLGDLPKGSYFTTLDPYKMYFSLNLQYDQSALDHLSSIFDTQDRSFMQFDRNLAKDTSGNKLRWSSEDKPIQAGPAIIFWELDMMDFTLTLVFTEDVESNFSPRKMIIQESSNSTGSNVILSTSTNFSYVDRQYLHPYSTLAVVLDEDDVLALRMSGVLEGPLFLSCEKAITTARSDISLFSGKYQSIKINSTSALEISNYILDTRPPTILEYSIDLTSGVLTLYASEPLDSDSLVVSKISLLSFSSGEVVRLSAPPKYMDMQSPAVMDIGLGEVDLFAVKRAWIYAPLDGMMVEQGCVADILGVKILANSLESLIPMVSFVADTSPPQIVLFHYDASHRLLRLVLDEEVDVSAISTTSIVLSNQLQSGGELIGLSEYTLIVPGRVPRYSNSIKLDLALLKMDAARVDNSINIGKDKVSTNILLPPLTDIFGNQLIRTDFFPCTEYTADLIPPDFLSFDFFLSGSEIIFTLYFSEVIALSTFSCADFTLISSDRSEVAHLASATCSLVSSIDSFQVAFSIQSSFLDPYAMIGKAPYSDTTSMVISSAQPVTSDKAMNSIRTTSGSEIISFGSRVTGSLLDMSAGSAIVAFSSAVGRSPDKFTPNGIGFYSMISRKAIYLSSGPNSPEVGSIVAGAPTYDYAVTLTFSNYDVDALRTLPLARDFVSILLTAQSVLDERGFPAQPIAPPRGSVVTYFTDDSQEPHLLSVILDKSNDNMVFEFDEPIQSKGVDLTKIALQNDAISATLAIELTGGIFIPIDEFGKSLKLTLNLADSTRLKLAVGIGSDVTDTFLTVSFGCFSDYSGRFLDPAPRNSAITLASVVPDTVAPRLDFFDIDMSAGIITFTFSEAIPISAIDLTEMTIQSAAFVSEDSFSNASSFRLRGGTFLSGDGASVSVRMLPQDYEAIQTLDNLARRTSSALLTLTSSAAADVAGNAVVPIPNGMALRSRVFLPDRIRPRLLSAAIDLNTEILTFIASEPIDLQTVNAAYLTAINSIKLDQVELSSSSAVLMPMPHMTHLDIRLSTKDFSKVQNVLGPNKTALRISVNPQFCRDTAGNNVIEAFLIPVVAPYKDVTRPLLEYYSLDMSDSFPVVTLVYSEALDPATLNFLDMNIQRYPIRKYGHFVRLGRAALELGSGALSSTVTLRIDEDTANEMRWFGIGRDSSTSLLSWGRTLAADFSGNFIAPVYDRSLSGESNNPIEPHLFVPDTTPPELQNWFFADTAKEIHLRFTESVEVTNLAGIGFANISGGSPVWLSRHNATVSYAVGFGVAVAVSNVGKDLLALFSGPGDKIIVVSDFAIRDRALPPNYLNGIESDHQFTQGGPGTCRWKTQCIRVWHISYL